MSSNEMVFPITLDYVKDWGAWEVVREFASNALDADPGFRMTLSTEKNTTKKTLFIRSQGASLGIRHLLFGVSEKDSPDARGQFGEGLKLALLVLTRMGLVAYIHTKELHLWNAPAEIQGELVFKVRWKNHDAYDQDKTYVEIPNWPYELFEERFLRPGDPRILFTDPFGRSILEQDSPDIFVKGIWVQKAKGYGRGYTFGYDLVETEMNRDRGVVDAWKVSAEVGKLWASVTDSDLLERFWQAVNDASAERNCQMQGSQIKNRKALARTFRTVFGVNAVIETGEAATKEAAHRGAKPIGGTNVGYSLKEMLGDVIGTDAQYIAETEGGDRKYMPDKRLDVLHLKHLRMLRRLAKRLGFTGKVYAYLLPQGVGGEAYKNDIRINITNLGSDEKAIAILIHELAHVLYNTADATEVHTNAIALIGAKLVASYASRR